MWRSSQGSFRPDTSPVHLETHSLNECTKASKQTAATEVNPTRSPLASFLFHLQLGIFPMTSADSEQNKSLLIGAPSQVTLKLQSNTLVLGLSRAVSVFKFK